MATNTAVGSDTLVLYDRVFADFADADAIMVEFTDDATNMKRGKNGNTIYTKNEMGKTGTLTIRIAHGSSDDKFLNSKVEGLDYLPSVVFAEGQYVKHVGDGQGNVSRVVYDLAGGLPRRGINGKDNADGDTEQGVAVYVMAFAEIKRSIG